MDPASALVCTIKDGRKRTGRLPLVHVHLRVALRVDDLHTREKLCEVRVLALLAENLLEVGAERAVQVVLERESGPALGVSSSRGPKRRAKGGSRGKFVPIDDVLGHLLDSIFKEEGVPVAVPWRRILRVELYAVDRVAEFKWSFWRELREALPAHSQSVKA